MPRTRSRRLLGIALALAWTPPAMAGQVTLDYPDGACTVRFQYDDHKEESSRVRNTGDLLFGNRGGEFPQIGVSLEKIDAAALDTRCAAEIDRLRATKFLRDPAIQGYVLALQEAIEDYCDLTRIELRALENPSGLPTYRGAGTCTQFSEALEGKTDIVQLWREQIELRAKNNSNPDGFLRQQRAHETLPEFERWVRKEILVYGWHNCANRYARHNSNEFRNALEKAEKTFSNKFRIQVIDCEED